MATTLPRTAASPSSDTLLLRRALLLDAAASGALGLLMALAADPLADLLDLLHPDGRPRRYHHPKGLPAFTGGLVGYAGYDTVRYYEGEKLPAPPDWRPSASTTPPSRPGA